jgi:hypothetical protein
VVHVFFFFQISFICVCSFVCFSLRLDGNLHSHMLWTSWQMLFLLDLVCLHVLEQLHGLITCN